MIIIKSTLALDYVAGDLIIHIKERRTCRLCDSKKLVLILSLGMQYLPDYLDTPNSTYANKGPLDLVLCEECGLLQLKHTIDQDALYRKYWYKSSMSSTMVAALTDIITAAEKLINLKPEDIVIDVGSNDGTTLRQYHTKGLVTVGFEPSNLWELGRAGNTMIIHDYFRYKLFAEAFPGKKAKVITTISMLYDLERPNDFVTDVKRCLDEEGLWLIQMNYLVSMIENNTFDNISHEHLEYYSLKSLDYLLKRHDFEIFDIELNSVNGGSLRVYVKHKGSKIKGFPGAEGRLKNQFNYEKKLKLNRKEGYLQFIERVKGIRRDLLELLKREKNSGKRIFIYGSSNRGSCQVQYAGLTSEIIEKATDKNEEKWGKYYAGTGIPIISIEEYRRENPDYLLVLPYHFIDEIKVQEKEYLSKGGKMIVAIPKVRVITK